MHHALESLSDEEKDKLRKRKMPSSVQPMLAKLTHEHFSSDEWFFERKLDGERALAFLRDGKVTLKTRNGNDLSSTYPEIVSALESEADEDFIVDGEIVAFEGNVSSFARLQKRMQIRSEEVARQSDIAVYYYVFDILHFDGYDTESLSNRTRKSVLRDALTFESPIRYTQHRNTDGESYFQEACDKGWEGVIAKEADAAYVNSRTSKWLKFKCSNGQELVIAGYTKPTGNRIGFGALLVGYYADESLQYAGKVGTGFDDETLTSLHKKLKRLTRKTCPFEDPEEIKESDVTWVTPRLVGEFSFTEWTSSGKLRHPSYLGLRDDKKADDVIREEPGAR